VLLVFLLFLALLLGSWWTVVIVLAAGILSVYRSKEFKQMNRNDKRLVVIPTAVILSIALLIMLPIAIFNTSM
jgi:hypothetical protein